MRIALDVMGGDHAPEAILNGAVASRDLLGPQDRLILVGDRTIIEKGLAQHGAQNDPRFEIEASTQVIGMDELPTAALRSKPDSSIARWANLASRRCEPARRADVIISAGNTGACVAAAQMMMRRLPGVHRPGIAVTLPSFAGPVVVCDAGANISPKPIHLCQYAHMASIYATKILGISQPRVGLLSIGGEEGKGTATVKEASPMLRQDKRIRYVGLIEGRELFDNTCEVCVTEAFTGNVVLKLAEGLATGIFKTISREITAKDPALAVKFEPIVKAIYKKHDYHEYGGAPLLGANGTCLICHGSSEARTIRNAVISAMKIVRLKVNEAIVEALGETQETPDEVQA